MRFPTTAFALALALTAATATAQCPYYNDGSTSAGLSRFTGGEDARLVYVDCLPSIGAVKAKFGTPSGSSALDGLPLTIAVYDDPTDDRDPSDAVLVARASVPGGVTGGNTGRWQTFDLNALLGAPVPTTGGMWVAVGVTYPASTSPGPGSIEFGNNIAPGTQWLATDNGAGIDYANIQFNSLVDIQTGPGFPPGSWVIQVESGADYRAFGSGCAGSNGTPTLAGGMILPVVGQVALFQATNLPDPSSGDLLAIGAELLEPTVDLGALITGRANGCVLQIQPLVTVSLNTSNGAALYGVPLPSNPSVVGVSLLGQVVSSDALANRSGLTVSNGLRAVIGY